MTQKSKKNLTVIVVTAVVVVGWFVSALFFGPDSERGIAKEVESLQKDSIALQGNFAPHGQYTYIQDICKEVKEIKSLGDPLRFGHTETDSIRIFNNERTAPIAKYNISKCDSILVEVLPLWRASAIFALGFELKEKNPNTVVRTNKNFPEYTGIEVYSVRYTSKEEIEKDANIYNPELGYLGFKSITYSLSPESQGLEYTFK